MSQNRLSTARILVFDTETTGVSPTDDRVVELGAAYFQGGTRLRWHRMLINPGCPIPPEASNIHGIWDKDVADAPGFGVVGARFAAHLSGEAWDGLQPVLAGYNAAHFDAPILNAEFARAGLSARIDAARVVDPFVFMKWHHRDLRGRKLSEACAHYGLTLVDAHSAAADAQATGELLAKMVEAGKMPDDLEVCLAEQKRLGAHCEAEFAQYRTWMYHDRITGELRIGNGKHVGKRLIEVDTDWFRYILRQIDDLPTAVRAEFSRHA